MTTAGALVLALTLTLAGIVLVAPPSPRVGIALLLLAVVAALLTTLRQSKRGCCDRSRSGR